HRRSEPDADRDRRQDIPFHERPRNSDLLRHDRSDHGHLHRGRPASVGKRVRRIQDVGRHLIELGGEAVEYTLRRSDRKTLGITVEPDGHLVVTAPWAAAFTDIEAVLWRRRHWILRYRRQTAALPPPIPPREWVSGETHRYLRSEERRVVKECRSVGVSRHRHRVSALVMAVG